MTSAMTVNLGYVAVAFLAILFGLIAVMPDFDQTNKDEDVDF